MSAALTALGSLAIVLPVGITLGAWAKRWSERTAARLIYGEEPR